MKKYEPLSSEKIINQFNYHGRISSTMDKFMMSSHADRYTHKTSSGFGCFVMMTMPSGKFEMGSINYGFIGDQLIHKKFDSLTENVLNFGIDNHVGTTLSEFRGKSRDGFYKATTKDFLERDETGVDTLIIEKPNSVSFEEYDSNGGLLVTWEVIPKLA